MIEREGHTLLYGHDSAMFAEETWEALGRFSFDCVVLDCTMVEKTGIFAGHMGLPDNIRVRERMLAEGNGGCPYEVCGHPFCTLPESGARAHHADFCRKGIYRGLRWDGG